MRAYTETQIISLQKQNDILKEKLKSRNETVSEIKINYQRLLDEISGYNDTVSKLKSVIHSLKNQQINLEKKLKTNANNEFKDYLDTSNEKFESHLQMLKNHIHDQENKISELEDKYEAFEKLSYIKTNEELERLRNHIQHQERKIFELENKCKDFENVSISHTNEELNGLQNYIKAQEKKNIELEIKCKAFEKLAENHASGERESLQDYIQVQEKRIIELEKKHKSSSDKNTIEEAERVKLEEYINKERYAQLMAEIESAYQEIAAKDKKMQQLLNQQVSYKKQMTSLMLELEKANMPYKNDKLSAILLDSLKLINYEFAELKSFCNHKLESLENEMKVVSNTIIKEINNEITTLQHKLIQEGSLLNSEETNTFEEENKILNCRLDEQQKMNEKSNSSLIQAMGSIEKYEKFLKNLYDLLPSTIEKNCEESLKYFKVINSITMDLSQELDEYTPENFVERIGEIKDDRDSSYLELQRLSGILNELEEFSGVSSSKLLNYIKEIQNKLCKE